MLLEVLLAQPQRKVLTLQLVKPLEMLQLPSEPPLTDRLIAYS